MRGALDSFHIEAKYYFMMLPGNPVTTWQKYQMRLFPHLYALIFDILYSLKYWVLLTWYLNTITYKSRLTQKKLHKKTDAIFSIYGRNGINPWHFFLILSWAFRGHWGRRRPPSEGGRFWGWKKNFTKKNNLALQLCFPCYGIFPTRNALKLTFVFFQLQLYGYYIVHCRG